MKENQDLLYLMEMGLCGGITGMKGQGLTGCAKRFLCVGEGDGEGGE